MFGPMMEYIENGGVIMYPILLVSLIVWYIGLLKLYRIFTFRRERVRFMAAMSRYLGGGVLVYRGDEHFEALAEDLRSRHRLSLERLKVLLSQEIGKRPDMTVVIVSDQEAAIKRTIQVMDVCNLAGATKVSVAAEQDES